MAGLPTSSLWANAFNLPIPVCSYAQRRFAYLYLTLAHPHHRLLLLHDYHLSLLYMISFIDLLLPPLIEACRYLECSYTVAAASSLGPEKRHGDTLPFFNFFSQLNRPGEGRLIPVGPSSKHCSPQPGRVFLPKNKMAYYLGPTVPELGSNPSR